MTTYSDMIDGLQEVLITYEGEPSLRENYAATLEMVKRGKHYDEAAARIVLLMTAEGMREDAAKLEALARED